MVLVLVTEAVEEDEEESWSPFAIRSPIRCRNVSGVA